MAKAVAGRRFFSSRASALMAIVFVFAQLLLAAHNPAEAGELESHTKAECVFCLAAPITPDPDSLIALPLPPQDAAPSTVAVTNDLVVVVSINEDGAPRAPPQA